MTEKPDSLRGLEAYGFGRMALGLIQLAGLSSGLIFLELWVDYPDAVRREGLRDDVTAFLFLAIFFRAVFHVLAGIGLARARNWARYLLFFGWPVVFLIHFGVMLFLFDSWRGGAPSVAGGMSAVSWFGIVLTSAWVILDVTWINSLIRGLVFLSPGEEPAPRIPVLTLVVSAVGIVLAGYLVMMTTRSRDEGFHGIYYKTTSPPAAARVRPGVKTPDSPRTAAVGADTKKKEPIRADSRMAPAVITSTPSGISPEEGASEEDDGTQLEVTMTREESSAVKQPDVKPDLSSRSQKSAGPSPEGAHAGVPPGEGAVMDRNEGILRNMTGVIAAFTLLIGLAARLFTGVSHPASLSLTAFGFFLWGLYGYISGDLVMAGTFFAASLFSVLFLYRQSQNE